MRRASFASAQQAEFHKNDHADAALFFALVTRAHCLGMSTPDSRMRYRQRNLRMPTLV